MSINVLGLSEIQPVSKSEAHVVMLQQCTYKCVWSRLSDVGINGLCSCTAVKSKYVTSTEFEHEWAPVRACRAASPRIVWGIAAVHARWAQSFARRPKSSVCHAAEASHECKLIPECVCTCSVFSFWMVPGCQCRNAGTEHLFEIHYGIAHYSVTSNRSALNNFVTLKKMVSPRNTRPVTFLEGPRGAVLPYEHLTAKQRLCPLQTTGYGVIQSSIGRPCP